MNKVRRYFLPLVAGASLLIGLSAVSSPVASAKGACTVKTGCGTIKISPKSVTASGTAVNLTVKGKGFTPNDASVDLVECQVGAVAEASCDVTTAVPVTVSGKGTFTATFPFLTDTYADGNKDSCKPATKPIKNCGIAAGNEAMTDDAGPDAVTIKAPKA